MYVPDFCSQKNASTSAVVHLGRNNFPCSVCLSATVIDSHLTAQTAHLQSAKTITPGEWADT